MQTNFKEQLLDLGQNAQALNISEQDLQSRVDHTIAQTFMWMGSVLLVAFAVGYGVASGMLPIPLTTTLMWTSRIGWFALIMLMSWRWQRMSYGTLAILFVLFGVLEGYGLSTIFLAYTWSSIFQVFLLSSGMFFWLAVAGYYLHIDIARVAPVLTTWLIMLIIALLINSFRQNSAFNIWLSAIWLILFAWLIIYDMNVLKQQALAGDDRISILMALGLFINFLNVFLFLLRLFGSRR